MFGHNNKKASVEAVANPKKHLQFVWVVIISIVLLFIAIYAMLPKVKVLTDNENFTQDSVKKASMEVIDCIDAEDYEKLRSLSEDALAKKLMEGSLEKTISEIKEGGFGARKSVTRLDLYETKQNEDPYAVAQVLVAYENVEVTYYLYFNQELQLCNLNMK